MVQGKMWMGGKTEEKICMARHEKGKDRGKMSRKK